MVWTEEDKTQAMKDWYERNKKEHKQNIKQNKKERVEWFKTQKSDWVCDECGEKRLPTLQFHHTPDNNYSKSPRVMAGEGYAKTTIKKELEKGRVLCANCHRMIHSEDHGFED